MNTKPFSKALRVIVAAAALTATYAGAASAYIGPSFLQMPGVDGGWAGDQYKNWIKFEEHYWKADDTGGISIGRRNNLRRSRMIYSGPAAPRSGGAEFVVAIDKHAPGLPQMMDACLKKTKFPEMSYAESSVRNRGLSEIGATPDNMPAYFEYKLKDVQFTDCPVVANAPEQAFVVAFNDIEWLNYHTEGDFVELPLQPAVLSPIKSTGMTKSFVVTWFAVAHDVTDDQCPQLNPKSTEADYYALMSKDDAAKERATATAKGISYENGQMAHRGPHKLNACMLPGSVPDGQHIAPQSKFARGLNLDGDDGAGAPPANSCAHPNYVSMDGKQTGIDNQLYTVEGCMNGYLGHKGFLMQYSNEQRKNGALAILVQVSGIDNMQNDDNVDVTILYSLDHMAKNGAGTQILPDYTFRITDKPEYTHYFTRLHGRIVDGVVITDRVKELGINSGRSNTTLYQAGLRLEFMADGSLKGVVGGYEDWRRNMEFNNGSNSENLYGFQCPAMYNALKRAADGLKDPVTGECDGISAAYDVEGVPAFIPPGQYKAMLAEADTHAPQVP